MPADSLARNTYDTFASTYDAFTSEYQNERWTARLLSQAETWSLPDRTMLDVGCGTGKSFLPMLKRGWQVTACDISPEMLSLARAKAEGAAEILEADVRALPTLGSYSLVWALDDVLNYLSSPEELETSLLGMRRNVAPDGVVLFDLNTLAGYRYSFAEGATMVKDDGRLIWRGQTPAASALAGSSWQARIEAPQDQSKSHTHRQRHFPLDTVTDAISNAGLALLSVLGESSGELTEELDEAVHTKVVYIARRVGSFTSERE